MTDLVISTDRPAHGERPRVDAQGTAMLVMNEALARSQPREAEEAARDRRVSMGRRAHGSTARAASG